jgi:hypothetical protein
VQVLQLARQDVKPACNNLLDFARNLPFRSSIISKPWPIFTGYSLNRTRNLKSHDPYHPYPPYLNLNSHSRFRMNSGSDGDFVCERNCHIYAAMNKTIVEAMVNPHAILLQSKIGPGYESNA